MSTPNLPKYAPPFEAQFDAERADEYVILKLLRQLHTATLVEVLAVRPTAGKVGFVDVQPLVLDQDTNGFVIAQTPIFNVPYVRYQGGTSAVILDPAVNDIGLAIFAEHDITNVKATQTPGAAPTQRVFSSADGLYIGGVLNADPVQWLRFSPGGGGIDINSPGNVTIEGANVTITASGAITATSTGNTTVNAAGFIINAPTTFNGTVTGTTTGAGTVTFAATVNAPDVKTSVGSVNAHYHGGVQTGSGTTGSMQN